MEKITAVSVEHDGQSVFSHDIPVSSPDLALALALQRIRFEIQTAPGKVTRVWFTYASDEEE